MISRGATFIKKSLNFAAAPDSCAVSFYHFPMKHIFTIGIDEVGRGALAGPVVVAAAMVRRDRWLTLAGQAGRLGLGVLKDSKKLSARQREAWFAYFAASPDIAYAAARVYSRGIERLNISRAANLAAERALAALIKKCPTAVKSAKIILDGGLYVGNGPQPKNAKTMIKADESVPIVSVASIIAKITRDRFMKSLARRHPAYGFEVHKGYGTAIHRKAIRAVGPCPAHRLTFLRKTL